MSADENDIEPKLTVKLRSEITEPEPFEYTVLKGAEPIVEPEGEEDSIRLEQGQMTIKPEDEERFEEIVESVDIPKIQKSNPQQEKAIKSKVRKIPKNESKDKPISKLHTELRKHSDARKKTDLAILNIRRELKDLLLVHHSTIRDLQKQIAQMHRKIATIENSRKTTNVKTSAKKTSTGKKKSSNKKSIKKSSQKKSRKR